MLIENINKFYRNQKLKFSIKSQINSDRKVLFWWRDDDISDVTEGLTNILMISEIYKIPIYISVIPERISDDAISLINEYSNISVLQHGYSHNNYAKEGEPLSEFGLDRDIKLQLDEIKLGFEKLRNSFNDKFLPIFVPPWNHIASPIINELSELGFRGVSCLGNNLSEYPNLFNNNVKIDIHSWQTKSETEYKSFCKEYSLIIKEISDLITNTKDSHTSDISIGLLTHSQIMSKDDFTMIHQLIIELKKTEIHFIKRDEYFKN